MRVVSILSKHKGKSPSMFHKIPKIQLKNKFDMHEIKGRINYQKHNKNGSLTKLIKIPKELASKILVSNLK